MKRYLKIVGELVFATDTLTKDDLAKLMRGSYDLILDLENWTQFDKDNNQWVAIVNEET